MKVVTFRTFVSVAALSLVPIAAWAQSPVSTAASDATQPVAFTPSPLAMPVATTEVTAPTGFEAEDAAPSNLAVGYYPRYRRPRYREYNDHRTGADSQIHAGFFDPTGELGPGFVLGFRGGPEVDPHIQLGLAVDWWHKSEDNTITLGSETRNGVPISSQVVLSSSQANLFPILAYIQVSGDQSMQIIPYVGAGAGYEALFLSGTDTTGANFDETFGGFGWQGWAGVGVPLSGNSRLNAEVFGNWSQVGRDVEDPTFGTVREVVKMDGVGARFGVSWGF